MHLKLRAHYCRSRIYAVRLGGAFHRKEAWDWPLPKTVEIQLTLRYPLHLGRPNGLHALFRYRCNLRREEGRISAPSTDEKYFSAKRVCPRSGAPTQSAGTHSSNSRT